MKRTVWQNKSNGQLCITIPRNSSITEGEIVEVQKSGIATVSYIGVVGDLFHYGHLQSIKFASSVADYTICGVFTDEAVAEYRSRPIATVQERKAVIESISCVDAVMVQQSRDPTENLKKVRELFPQARLILVHGDNWKEVPGAEYVRSIGGTVLQHPYYHRLSTFKILQSLLENKDGFKDLEQFTSFIGTGKRELSSYKTIISSKADTLKALQPILTKSRIEPLLSFTISDWKNSKAELLSSVETMFGGSLIVVRSSAVSEDGEEESQAGSFKSVLNVHSNQPKEVEDAVRTVLHSYKEKHAESSFNQILIQKQTDTIVLAGVVLTRTLGKNAPYYVINYDTSGSSDSVTSGREQRTLYLAHSASPPDEFRKVVEAVQEIEQLIPGVPLDIEFALTAEQDVVLFQVRPLAANWGKTADDAAFFEALQKAREKFIALTVPVRHLAGNYTFFADMPDWNPAEIIGHAPHRLDYSLYDYLITNTAWHEARTSQGYYNVAPARLVELFGNKPYVNVRNTFNSFIPAVLSPLLREKLVSFYMEKLRQHPHLQDKVEFEVLYTCYDLTFPQRVKELADFTEGEITELRDALLDLTNELIQNASRTIQKDLHSLFQLDNGRKAVGSSLSKVRSLLEDCRRQGTVQFSRIARLGFIAKALLKSMVAQGILTTQQYDDFFNSISTVATTLRNDFIRLGKGILSRDEFLQKYAHLRPGTYDITSPCYGLNPHLLEGTFALSEAEKEFSLPPDVQERITTALHDNGLQSDASRFLEFARQATEARELGKFEFTKNLSEALECIASAGEEMGFTRSELALLDIQDILLAEGQDVSTVTTRWKELIVMREKERAGNEMLHLPPLIFSKDDFTVVQSYLPKPNFITQKSVKGKVIHLHTLQQGTLPDIEGNIVLLEHGDPGYDWIFTRNPAGLITKYGGVASHMSIRCAEFGIPAAIGCGDLFEQIASSPLVHLDCRTNTIINHQGVWR